ncbi:MAG: ATP-dependent DNA helicase [Pseudomonadales bacterium]
MSRSQTVSVKHLVESTCREGDLYTAVDGRATAEEGIACQRALQHTEPDSYEPEAPYARLFLLHGVRLQLRGRADGRNLTTSPPRLDEIKTSRANPVELEAKRGHLHWAQLRVYAALQALELPGCLQYELRLRYVHPDSGAEHCSTRVESRDSLLEFLCGCLQKYGLALAALWQRRRLRDAALADFSFPLPQFRPNQRVLAARAFQALAAGESLLLEASTGIGKSIGVLFPALRAFGRGPAQRYFYLTARRTGALAAVRAMEQLNQGGAPVRWVQLQAKGQLCQLSGAACVPTECPNAVGYYDRVAAALHELDALCALDPPTVLAVAQQHQLCPFELSLDAAQTADVIIGDYNYVFDPDVRLQRFADGRDIGLLIDEAHQLVPRTRAMLSAELDQGLLQAARSQTAAGPLRKRLDSVKRAWTRMLRDAGERTVDYGPLDRALDRLLKECATLDWHTELNGPVQEFLWSAARWQRRALLLEDLPSLRQLTQRPGARLWQLQHHCLDCAPYLQRLFAGCAADVRFSGTLQPPALYQRLQGRLASGQSTIASPFRPDQLALGIVRDIPTYYRARTGSLPALVALIARVLAARTGTYLIALPSFEYLAQLQQALLEPMAAADVPVHAQQRGMDAAAQASFLLDLQVAGRTQVALVVLGGVFAESVDFTGVPLVGVLCVGVGLAPPSALRDAEQQHFDSAGADGALAAYTQPAMVKVVQMAGRLLRSPADRGVLLLIDERFAQPRYAQFFPEHWQPQVLPAAAVTNLLENFWSEP